MELFDDVIRSRQNRAVVELCKLTERKHREEKRMFRFDGIKLLDEALQKGLSIEGIFLREDKSESIRAFLAERHGADVYNRLGAVRIVSEEVFEKISEEKSPEGVITIAKYIDKFEKFATIYNSADFFKVKKSPIVLLESVRDPSNLGAIVRSAAALGVQALIVSKDCADIYHPKAIRASMGMITGLFVAVAVGGEIRCDAGLFYPAVSVGDVPVLTLRELAVWFGFLCCGCGSLADPSADPHAAGGACRVRRCLSLRRHSVLYC